MSTTFTCLNSLRRVFGPETGRVLSTPAFHQNPLWLSHQREMSRVKQRTTHPRYTWTKKRRERHDQELTSDNQAFLGQVILQKYGPAYQDGSSGMPWVSPLKDLHHERTEWTSKSLRVGVIAKKIGVHPMWDDKGNRFMTTLLQVVDNHIVKYIPPETVAKNYPDSRFRPELGILLVGAQSADPQLFTKEYCGLFQEAGILPKVRLHRFAITPDAYLMPGTPLYASHFFAGQYVDVIGKTVERGWQGVMRRWGFKGMPATHGVTKSHRRGGNTGGGGEKGRVWPGTKIPGHMGSRWRVHKGLQIVRINSKYNVIYIRGVSVQGDPGSYLCLRDTCLPLRRAAVASTPPPFPTYFPEELPQSHGEGDSYASSVFKFTEPSITFEENR